MEEETKAYLTDEDAPEPDPEESESETVAEGGFGAAARMDAASSAQAEEEIKKIVGWGGAVDATTGEELWTAVPVSFAPSEPTTSSVWCTWMKVETTAMVTFTLGKGAPAAARILEKALKAAGMGELGNQVRGYTWRQGKYWCFDHLGHIQLLERVDYPQTDGVHSQWGFTNHSGFARIVPGHVPPSNPFHGRFGSPKPYLVHTSNSPHTTVEWYFGNVWVGLVGVGGQFAVNLGSMNPHADIVVTGNGGWNMKGSIEGHNGRVAIPVPGEYEKKEK